MFLFLGTPTLYLLLMIVKAVSLIQRLWRSIGIRLFGITCPTKTSEASKTNGCSWCSTDHPQTNAAGGGYHSAEILRRGGILPGASYSFANGGDETSVRRITDTVCSLKR